MKIVVCVVLLLVALVGTSWAHPFFNSSEPGCDGSDPNVLMCDDFETDQSGRTPGNWYSLHCDAANQAGGIGSQSKGWCGTIYANPITPSGAVDCNSAGAAGTRCAATSGPLTAGSPNRNMADHSFVNNQEVQEVYVRWMTKQSANMLTSGQKVLSVNRCCNTGGIFWGGLGYNIGAGAPQGGAPDIGFVPIAEDRILTRNVGSGISLTPGRYYYYELRMKLNTPGQRDGVFEMWINDCGVDGRCSGSPTKRMSYTGLNWGKTSSNGGIGTLWWENWSNSGNGQASTGQEWYDQIKVSKVGPIGFPGSTGTPAPPVPPADATAPAPPGGLAIR